MKKNSSLYFHKTLRKYRNLQQRLTQATTELLTRQLSRKLDILQRRLLRLNRQWKLGIASAVLMAWMAGPVQAQLFPANIDLDTLKSPQGFVINGIDGDDQSGRSVSGAGDINGDGIDDLIIGAWRADPNGKSNAGESYVVFGANTFADSLNLADLNGTNGFVLNGIDEFEFSGFSVSGAGDINGDGIDDLIIGAFNAGPNGNSNAGESYVVFGANIFADSLNLADLNGTNGFVINGIDAYDHSGRSVSGAGDINGDGIDDLIIGALDADPNGNSSAGESYIVFGANTFADSLNLADLNGTNGFVLNGIDAGDQSSFSLSGAGDINRDGIEDLIIGARNAGPNGNSNAGESYVVFGANIFADSLNLAELNGTNGFVLNGIDAFDNSGFSVSGAGDINGDGIDDIVIGALRADPNGNSYAGESYVVFGGNTFADSFNLADLYGTKGFVLNGIDSHDNSGFSVSGAGDINGDGIEDLIIGASSANQSGNNNAGESYVVFGSNTFADSLNLADLNGTNGFALIGIDADDFSGISVSGAGDINGDGIDDLIIGAFLATPNGNSYAGESYVVFGQDVNASLEDLKAMLSLEIFPNPTSGKVTLQATAFGQAAQVEVSVFDLLGREVAASYRRTGSERYELDIASVPRGTYLLRVVADEEVGTSRVVKK